MQQQTRHNYLQAEVQTAAPQKVQLMLIEAAIKNVHRTKKAWSEERFDAGFESLSRAQDIVAEILSGVDKKANPDLAGKIASIYVFIFRCLAEGGMTHDPLKLEDALRILNAERETWRMVCEKFGSAIIPPSGAAGGADPASGITVGTASAVASSDRLDLSSSSSVKSPVSPKPSGITTAAFAKPNTAPAATGKPATGRSWDV